MADFSVIARLDTRPLEALAESLGRVKFAAAAQQAVADTVRTGTALVAREIAKVVNLKISDIKETIRGKRGSFTDLSGAIVVTRKPVPLYQYLSGAQRSRVQKKLQSDVRGKFTPRGGIVVRVRKGGDVQTYPTSFVAVVGSGHIGVFRRKWEGSKRVARLPIKERMGPTAVGVFVNAQAKGSPRTILEEVTRGLADQLIARVMSKAKWLSETDDATTRRLLAKAARVLHEPVE